MLFLILHLSGTDYFLPFCPFRLSREWKVNRVGIISVSLGITILGIKGDGHCEFCDRFEEEL